MGQLTPYQVLRIEYTNVKKENWGENEQRTLKKTSTKSIQENYNKGHWRPTKDMQKYNKGNSKEQPKENQNTNERNLKNQQRNSKSTTSETPNTKKGIQHLVYEIYVS